MAATFVLGYFSATSIPNLIRNNQVQYAWEANKNLYRSDAVEEETGVASWYIKELGIELKVESIAPNGEISAIKMNDKIDIKKIVKIQINSKFDDLVLKYSNKSFIIIPKGTAKEPLLIRYDTTGIQSLVIYGLNENNPFNVKFNYEITNE